MATTTASQHNDGIIQKSLDKGPHGIGDPDDRSLRKVEKEIMIPLKMKEKAKHLKCADEVRGFGVCAKEQGFLMPFKCREEAEHLKTCLQSAYADSAFADLCTQEYLDERSEYRRTGIKTKERKKQMKS